MTYSEQKRQAIVIEPKMTQILELVDKDVKATFTTMFSDAKENGL